MGTGRVAVRATGMEGSAGVGADVMGGSEGVGGCRRFLAAGRRTAAKTVMRRREWTRATDVISSQGAKAVGRVLAVRVCDGPKAVAVGTRRA